MDGVLVCLRCGFSPDIAELSSEADCTGLWVAWAVLAVFAALFMTAKKLRAKELPDEKYPFDTNRFRADMPMWKIMVCLVWMVTCGWWVGLIRIVLYVASSKCFGGYGIPGLVHLIIRRPKLDDSRKNVIWLCSHHASIDLMSVSDRHHKVITHKKVAFLSLCGNWIRDRLMIWKDFYFTFDKWDGTEDLVVAPAGFTTAPGFNPGIPAQYIDKPHSCDRFIVEVTCYSPFNICMRVDKVHVISDLIWCLSQPYIITNITVIAEISANTTPQITHDTLRDAFERVGVKYLPEWTVKRRYGKQ